MGVLDVVHAGPFGGAELILDLRRAEFVSPYGAVGILSSVAAHVTAGGQIRTLCPEQEGCRRYLAASGMLQHLAELGELEGDGGLRSTNPSWTAGTVLPLTSLSAESEIAGTWHQFEDRLRSLLSRTGDGNGPKLGPIGSTLFEICQNVFDHAGEGRIAWVAAQQYLNRWTQMPFIEIAIGDAGCGIRTSLGSTHSEVLHGTDSEAIVRALRGLSRKPGYSGNGYGVLQDAARNLDGSFLLQSGTGVVRRPRRKSLIRTDRVLSWPGTRVQVCLTCCNP